MRLEEKETTGGITQEEIRRVAGQIRVGDKIEWKVITYTFDGKTKPRKKKPRKKKLTVTRKSRHLLEAADGKGRTYSITYAELAVESRSENARVIEMLRASERVKNNAIR